MNYEVFQSDWCEQISYLALCELQAFFSLIFPQSTLHSLENILWEEELGGALGEKGEGLKKYK